MCLALGIIGDEEVGLVSKRALEGIMPLRPVDAAAELPGAVDAQWPLVVIASYRDRLGDSVVPHLIEVRVLRPQIGVVLIPDVGAPTAAERSSLTRLGAIRSVPAQSRGYAASLRKAVEEQAERYRAEYIMRAFAPHIPGFLLPLLDLCARRWGRRLTSDDVAAALKHDRHTIGRWVSAAQPACQLGDVLRFHHAVDIMWEFYARGRSPKVVAQQLRHRPTSRLNASLRRWLGADLRAPGSAGVQGWEELVDRFVAQFTYRPRAESSSDPRPLQH